MAIEKQTTEIAEGVHVGRSDEDIGAGDQVLCENIISIVDCTCSLRNLSCVHCIYMYM